MRIEVIKAGNIFILKVKDKEFIANSEKKLVSYKFEKFEEVTEFIEKCSKARIE